jgi:hypothetical protein
MNIIICPLVPVLTKSKVYVTGFFIVAAIETALETVGFSLLEHFCAEPHLVTGRDWSWTSNHGKATMILVSVKNSARLDQSVKRKAFKANPLPRGLVLHCSGSSTQNTSSVCIL